MDPTSVPGSSAVPPQNSMSAYLERFGGYHKDRTIGLAQQWQCALAMDLLAKGETKGAGDTLAMLIFSSTRPRNPDLAWLMTHLADCPNGVFQDRTVTPTTSLRPFSPLADQRLVATTLAFVKELETLSTRKGEVAKPKPPKHPPKLPDAGAKQRRQHQHASSSVRSSGPRKRAALRLEQGGFRAHAGRYRHQCLLFGKIDFYQVGRSPSQAFSRQNVL